MRENTVAMRASGRAASHDETAGPPDRRRIHETLRRDIIALRLRPGEKLSENELAARFGTSRAPVREALIRLIEDGLIEVLPQRGSFVGRISLTDMERARFVREALEIAIVRRAAERGVPPGLPALAEALLAEQAECRDDPERFTLCDDRFHRAFAEATGLSGVWAIIEREKAQFDRVRYLSLPAVTPVDVLIGQHRAILSAVLARDAAGAEAAMRSHMAEVLKVARDLAQRHPDLIQAEL